MHQARELGTTYRPYPDSYSRTTATVSRPYRVDHTRPTTLIDECVGHPQLPAQVVSITFRWSVGRSSGPVD